MNCVILQINGQKAVFACEEFMQYISIDILTAFSTFTGKIQQQFYDNLMYNWNTYSPQSESNSCFITAVCDENDLPNSTYYADLNKSRLYMAEYALYHYSKQEYNRIRQLINNNLSEKNKTVSVNELDTQAAISSQIRSFDEYKEHILSSARKKYEEIITEIRGGNKQ